MAVADSISISSPIYPVYPFPDKAVISTANGSVILEPRSNVTDHTGSGNDVIIVSGIQDSIYGDAGNDTIVASAWSDTLYGETGNDVIISDVGDNLAFGGAGDDYIKGGSGHTLLSGGSNDGSIAFAGNTNSSDVPASPVITSGGDTLAGGSGQDDFLVSNLSHVTTIKEFGSTDHIIISGYTSGQATGFGTNVLYLSNGGDQTALVGENHVWTAEDAIHFA